MAEQRVIGWSRGAPAVELLAQEALGASEILSFGQRSDEEEVIADGWSSVVP